MKYVLDKAGLKKNVDLPPPNFEIKSRVGWQGFPYWGDGGSPPTNQKIAHYPIKVPFLH